ncbi:hypothetical protein D3C73_1596480 [compost metagenome]
MLLLFLEEALGDKEREVGVAVTGLLEPSIQVLLAELPDFIAVRLEHDAAANR